MDGSYSIIELENNKSYLVVDEIMINDKKYLFLANENDKSDLLFQNINYDCNPPKLSKIETDEEFNKVSDYFGRKYRRIYN
jgi:hypothetical protein